MQIPSVYAILTAIEAAYADFPRNSKDDTKWHVSACIKNIRNSLKEGGIMKIILQKTAKYLIPLMLALCLASQASACHLVYGEPV